MTEPFVATISPNLAGKLEKELVRRGCDILRPQYTLFQAKNRGLSVTLYSSMKLVVQGKEMGEFIEFYLEPEILLSQVYTHKTECALAQADLSEKIGSDEAGKGDFFGPLVVASVHVAGEEDIRWLIDNGAADSKLLKDAMMKKLAPKIKERLAHEIVILRPEKYNELYASFSNLNTLLAWAHAQAISSLVKKTGSRNVLVDKFASEHLLATALKKKLPETFGQVRLEQKVRAESDPAVAAASILARAAFVQEIESLGNRIGSELPKGASKKVIDAGRAIVQQYGADILLKTAKWHFVTTQDVLQKIEMPDNSAKSKK